MENKETILKELTATSTILDKGIGLPYIVPENYFENLSIKPDFVELKTEILKEEKIQFPNLFVPDCYFNDLSSSIIATINREEIDKELTLLAPKLKTISNKMPYQLSDNYFNEFRVEDNQLTKSVAKIKVLSIYKNRWFQIAIAASVASVIAISGYFIADKTSNVNNNYASYKSVDVQVSVNKVSDDDLEKYLSNSDYLTSNTEVIIGDEGEDLNPKQEIKSVSDNELKKYLKEAGECKKTFKKGI